MSAKTAVLPARPASARRRARVTDLVAAEWLKLWSPWYTAAASAAVVVLSVVIAQHDPNPVHFDAPAWLLPMLAAGLLGAHTVVTEHATGLLRSTLIAVPDRRRLVAVKAAVVVFPGSNCDRDCKVAIERSGSRLHSDHDPGYKLAGKPAISMARISWAAVTPEPQYTPTGVPAPAPRAA